MANRRITEFPAINGLDINEQDLLTLVHVFEVDPTLRNKKITFEQFKDYLNVYYTSTSGATFSGNVAISGNLTVSGLGSFGTIFSSGLSTFSGIVVQNNAVVSGTVSGLTITGTNLQGVNVNATNVTTTTATGTTALFTSGQYQSLSGATITGGQGSFTSGTFVNLSGATITGTTVAATTGAFQTLSTPVLNVSGNLSVGSGLTVTGTAQFAAGVQVTGTLSGTTVTGTTARFSTVSGVSGVFTTNLSGTTITGNTVLVSNITGVSGVFTTRVSGATVTGNTGAFGNVSGISGVFTQFLSGAVITGDAGRFTAITGVSGVYINLSGATVTGNIVTATSITGVTGVFTSRISGVTVTGTTAQFTTISGVSGVFTTTLSGATITGNSVQASGLTVGTGNFVRVSGTTVTGDTGAFTNLTGIVGVFTTSVSGTTVIGTTVTGATGTFTSLTGTTITGTTVNATTGVFNTLQAVNLSFTNTTVSGNLTVVGSGYFGSGVSVTGTISGITVTGTSGQFTNITADTANFTTATGVTASFTTITGVTASFTTITGVTVTGTTANFTSGNFVSFSGGTYIATSGVFASGTAANPSISILGDADTGVYSPGANQLAITTSGTGRLFVNSAGNVGIGTSSLNSVLSVNNTVNASATGNFGGVYISSVGATPGLNNLGGAISFARINSGRRGSMIASVESGANTNQQGLAFFTRASTTIANDDVAERLRIDDQGRVGIGTTSPLSNLHVAGTAPGILVDETDAGVDEKYWRIRAEGSILRFEGVNDAFNATNAWLNVTRTTGARTVDNIAFSTGITERARIDSSGRLLVGTSSSLSAGNWSDSLIQVRGNSSGSTFEGKLALFTGRTIAAGIGAGESLGRVVFGNGEGGEAALIAAQADAGWSSSDYPSRLLFSTTADGASGPTERMRITSAGLVGIGASIGTWTPGVTLDVRSGSNNTTVEEIAAFARPDALVRASINKGVVSGNGISFGTTTNHPLVLRTNALERIVVGATGTTTLTSDTSTAPFIANIGASEAARIDSSGRLLVGTSTARANFNNTTIAPQFQLEGTTNSLSSASLIANGTASTINPQARLFLGRSRGALGTNVVVGENDALGGVSYQGNDGSEFVEAASISAFVDGTPGADDMPGRIVLSTTLDGASAPTEALRITNDKVVAYNQPDVTSKAAAATLTVAELKTKIIQYTGAAATLTLPTGTLTEGGFSGIYTNMTFEWSVINTGSGLCTIGAGTGHTIVGGATIAAGASGRFASRRTAANTFVTYRLS